MLSGLHRGTPLTLERLRPSLKEDPGRALQDEAAQSTPAAWPHQHDFEFNFHFNSGQRFHLMSIFLCGLPQHLQLLGMWGCASVCDGWTSLVGVTALPRRF